MRIREGECIPSRGLTPSIYWEEAGFRPADQGDDPELQPVVYPEGWRVEDRTTDLFEIHAFDTHERHRATFYRRNSDGQLWSRLRTRLTVQYDEERDIAEVVDVQEERALFEARCHYLPQHPASCNAAVLAARAWLDATFPAWRNPTAYWDIDVTLGGITRKVTRHAGGWPPHFRWLVFRVDVRASPEAKRTVYHYKVHAPFFASSHVHAQEYADAWIRQGRHDEPDPPHDLRVYVQRVPADFRKPVRPGSKFSVVFGLRPGKRYLDQRQYEAVLVTDQPELAQTFAHRGGDFSSDGVELMALGFEVVGEHSGPPRRAE